MSLQARKKANKQRKRESWKNGERERERKREINKTEILAKNM